MLIEDSMDTCLHTERFLMPIHLPSIMHAVTFVLPFCPTLCMQLDVPL